MKQIQLRKLTYHIRHRYITTNAAVIVLALIISATWAWGSVQSMERNYSLQKEIDYKRRQLTLAELETAKLKFEQNYFNSDEYKELAVRERLGLVNPGEKVLILPPNTVQEDETPVTGKSVRPVEQTNLQQWVNFLFGGASKRLQE